MIDSGLSGGRVGVDARVDGARDGTQNRRGFFKGGQRKQINLRDP